MFVFGNVQTGSFFGEIKGHFWIMSELTDKVYRRIEFVDYQAVCQRRVDTLSSNDYDEDSVVPESTYSKSAANSLFWRVSETFLFGKVIFSDKTTLQFKCGILVLSCSLLRGLER